MNKEVLKAELIKQINNELNALLQRREIRAARRPNAERLHRIRSATNFNKLPYVNNPKAGSILSAINNAGIPRINISKLTPEKPKPALKKSPSVPKKLNFI